MAARTRPRGEVTECACTQPRGRADTVMSEEEEGEPVDPKETVDQKCARTVECTKLLIEYEKCAARIDGKGSGHCSGQYMDYIGCIDHCVRASPPLCRVRATTLAFLAPARARPSGRIAHRRRSHSSTSSSDACTARRRRPPAGTPCKRDRARWEVAAGRQSGRVQAGGSQSSTRE